MNNETVRLYIQRDLLAFALSDGTVTFAATNHT